MISKLTGTIEDIEEDSITINVNGVGYLVHIPSGIVSVENPECVKSIYIQTIVKEDAINLYGFTNYTQKQLFNLLISVQGVGAKIALLIISRITPEDLQQAILCEDLNILKSINGIGAKVAQRLITELKDKIAKISFLRVPNANSQATMSSTLNNNFFDAIIALEGLGYNKFEISKGLAKIQKSKNTELSTEELIKEYLMYIAQGLGN